MSRSSLRKIAAAGLGAALIGSGLTVGLGAGVASAYDAATCTTSAEKTFSSAGTLGTDYFVSKSIDGDGTVAADGTVSFIVSVKGAGALINEIRDFAPADFRMTKVESDINYVIGGQIWKNETAKATQVGNTVSLGGAGWTTATGKKAALRVTYKAPSGIEPGTKIDAGGAGFKAVLIKVNPDFKDMNLCLTGRAPTAAETVIGSVDVFGSIGKLSGSLNDPSSPFNRLSDSLGG